MRQGWVVPVVVCLGLTLVAQKRVDDYPVLGDGVQNLLMAVNVFKHNTLSLDNNDHPKPTNFREPLPSLLMGLHLKLFAPDAVNQPFAAFRAGELTRTVKLANLGWLFAGLLGVWMIALRARRNNLAGLAACLLAFHFFFHGAEFDQHLVHRAGHRQPDRLVQLRLAAGSAAAVAGLVPDLRHPAGHAHPDQGGILLHRRGVHRIAAAGSCGATPTNRGPTLPVFCNVLA